MAIQEAPAAPPYSALRVVPDARAQSQTWGLRAALLVLCAASLMRAFLIKNTPLTGDEAYYWEWSRHLAAGYHDHPPLVAWLIAAFSIFGKSAFWVRFPSLLLSFLSGLFLFLFTEEIWKDGKAAFQAVCLFLLIPIFSISSLAIFPDAPLIFSWTLFLWASWKWLKDERFWPWMGAALGFAALSKLMGLFLIPSLLSFLILSKEHKGFLKRGSLWKGFGLALLLALPFLLWNFRHHFETFTYQASHRLAGNLAFSPSMFFNYASLQLVVLSPLVFVLLFGTACMLIARSFRGDSSSLFLLSMSLPIHLFFLVTSFVIHAGLHWALPGYLSIMAASSIWVEDCVKRGKRWARPLFSLAMISTFVFTLFLYGLLAWPEKLVPWISSLDLHYRSVNDGKTLNSQTLAEILGYQELGERVSRNIESMGGEKGSFVFTDSYTLSSIIGFYAGKQAKTLLFTSTGGEYDRWNNFSDDLGKDALYVDTAPVGSRPDIDKVLRQAFKKVIPLEFLEVKRGSLKTRTFYFARCIDLVDFQALRPLQQR